MSKIKVQETIINVVQQDGRDYISLTDMLKAKDGQFFIESWLRNRNTIEFLGIWEGINNPNFNYHDFDGIKKVAGLNSFNISVKEWVSKTNAIGITAKAGRYGGTYAHKDIAFEFGTWISPEFKLYLIKEFQRLKEQESKFLGSDWDFRRFLTKVNYRIHTDAIKDNIVPKQRFISKAEEGYIYANEAELLNVAVFGITSKEWREQNLQAALDGRNIRDLANVIQLNVLANLESYNSILIKEGLSPKDRFIKMKETAIHQLKSLSSKTYSYSIESPHKEQYEQTSTFNQNLKQALDYNPKEEK